MRSRQKNGCCCYDCKGREGDETKPGNIQVLLPAIATHLIVYQSRSPKTFYIPPKKDFYLSLLKVSRLFSVHTICKSKRCVRSSADFKTGEVLHSNGTF